MDLNELMVFVSVVQAGSMRKAAQHLGMPKSTVSRKVIELEVRLDSRLLQRTTRKLTLTEVGQLYYDHAVRIVADVENAERAVRSQQEAPRGLLRVTTPVHVSFLGPIVSDYMALYPEVHLEMYATERTVDLIEERFDVGIRTGPLVDSSLVARKLGAVGWWLAATPAYLDNYGRPRAPADLQKHQCLLFGRSNKITLERRGRVEKLTLNPRVLVTDFDLLQTLLNDGLGIALLPQFFCEGALQAGKLERVLPDWSSPSTTLHVIYPSARHVTSTVRSFIDHIQQRIPPLSWSS